MRSILVSAEVLFKKQEDSMEKQVTVLYDSLCPVCKREVDFLQFAGRKRNGLKLVDIASADFKPEAYGLTMDEAIGSLHGFDSDGKPIDGMDTVRAMYAAVGLGWAMSWTKLPLISSICNKAYSVFAHYRPRFSGFKPDQCETDRCKIG
jgi:predicted DCC family thiol-disulfide oxidoreductase YuxK